MKIAVFSNLFMKKIVRNRASRRLTLRKNPGSSCTHTVLEKLRHDLPSRRSFGRMWINVLISGITWRISRERQLDVSSISFYAVITQYTQPFLSELAYDAPFANPVIKSYLQLSSFLKYADIFNIIRIIPKCAMEIVGFLQWKLYEFWISYS